MPAPWSRRRGRCNSRAACSTPAPACWTPQKLPAAVRPRGGPPEKALLDLAGLARRQIDRLESQADDAVHSTASRRSTPRPSRTGPGRRPWPAASSSTPTCSTRSWPGCKQTRGSTAVAKTGTRRRAAGRCPHQRHRRRPAGPGRADARPGPHGDPRRQHRRRTPHRRSGLRRQLRPEGRGREACSARSTSRTTSRSATSRSAPSRPATAPTSAATTRSPATCSAPSTSSCSTPSTRPG